MRALLFALFVSGCGRLGFDVSTGPSDGQGSDTSDGMFDSADPTGANLVGYWKFDESSGTVAADSSGQGNAGTLMNGPTWTSGIRGGALDFDGVDDVVEIGTPPILDITSSFTIVSWIYPRTFGGATRGRIVNKNANDTGYTFRLDNTNAVSAFGSERDTGFGGDIVVSNSNVITLGTWQHIALSYDASDNSVAMYVDGAPAGTGSFPAPPSPGTNSFVIGNRPANDRQFDGLIDDVRIYSSALSATQITDLYNQP